MLRYLKSFLSSPFSSSSSSSNSHGSTPKWLILLIIALSFRSLIAENRIRVPLPVKQSDKQNVSSIPDSSAAAADPFRSSQAKRSRIAQMAREAWIAYSRNGWPADSLRGSRPYNGNFGPTSGHTIVAAMTTLWTIGLREQFEQGRQWIEQNLNFSKIDELIPVHATVTDYVGSLLSCYQLTGDSMFLERAREIAQTLEPAWRTKTDLPTESVNPKQGFNFGNWNTLSGVSGNAIEFAVLDNLITAAMTAENESDDDDNGHNNYYEDYYREKMRKSRRYLAAKLARFETLGSMTPDEQSAMQFADKLNVQNVLDDQSRTIISLNGDSRDFYYDLLRSYLRTGGRDREALRMYMDAIRIAIERVRLITAQSVNRSKSYAMVREFDHDSGKFDDAMNIESCYLGAMFARGAHTMRAALSANRSIDSLTRRAESERIESHWRLAEAITRTCRDAASRTATGLPPNLIFIERDPRSSTSGDNHPADPDEPDVEQQASLRKMLNRKFLLGPELAESYFVLYRLTRRERYRRYAWEHAQRIFRHCRDSRSGAYFTLTDVDDNDNLDDNDNEAKFGYQPAHFLSATLKYLFLTFVDDAQYFSLDNWVFTSAGHPFRIEP